MSKNNIDSIRRISPCFLEALKSGKLKELTDIVKQSDDLIMCFRNGYINVYYKSHSLFKITEQKQQYKFEFNLGHARYTDTFENISVTLEKLGIRSTHTISISEKNGGISHKYTAVFAVKEKETLKSLNSIILLYKSYLDDFFNDKKTYDMFRNCNKSGGNHLLEKIRQQEIFKNHMKITGIGTELLFYDMELSIPRESSKDKGKGSPDCMAAEFEDGKFKRIVLVEIKSTAKACKGKNGIEKHCKDFNKIITNQSDKENLYNAMRNALCYYSELGIYPKYNIPEYTPSVDFCIKYFFTDEAVAWTKNSRQTNDDYNVFKTIPKEQIITL